MNKSIKRKKNTIKKNNMYTLKSLKKKNNKKSLLKKKHFILKGGSDVLLTINKINYTPKQKHYKSLNELDKLMGNLLIEKMTDEGDLCNDANLKITNNSNCNLHLDRSKISYILKYQDIINDLKTIINALNNGSSVPSNEICSINFDESEIYLSNEDISKFMYGDYNKLSENTHSITYYFEINEAMKNNSFYNIITSNILNTFYNDVAKDASYLNNVIKTINRTSKCINETTLEKLKKWGDTPYSSLPSPLPSPVVKGPTNSQSGETFSEFLKQLDTSSNIEGYGTNELKLIKTNFSKWFKEGKGKYEKKIEPIINKHVTIVKGDFFVRLDDFSYYDKLKADIDKNSKDIKFHLYYINIQDTTNQKKSLESIQFVYNNNVFKDDKYGITKETLIKLIFGIESKLLDDNLIAFNYDGIPDPDTVKPTSTPTHNFSEFTSDTSQEPESD